MVSHTTIQDFIMMLESERQTDGYAEENLKLAVKLNNESLNQPKEKFEEIFLDEIGGLASMSLPFLKEALAYIFESEQGAEPRADGTFDWSAPQNMIYNLFKLGKISDELPTYRILAGLNANVRCGFSRSKFDANDFDDFRHAAASLPYYDYFFTENSLHHMITNKPTDYARLYNTVVKSKPQEVLETLKSIASTQSLNAQIL